MSPDEINSLLSFAKEGYKAALTSNSMTYEGRSITLEEPSYYIKEIERLEGMLAQANKNRTGYRPALGNWRNYK